MAVDGIMPYSGNVTAIAHGFVPYNRRLNLRLRLGVPILSSRSELRIWPVCSAYLRCPLAVAQTQKLSCRQRPICCSEIGTANSRGRRDSQCIWLPNYHSVRFSKCQRISGIDSGRSQRTFGRQRTQQEFVSCFGDFWFHHDAIVRLASRVVSIPHSSTANGYLALLSWSTTGHSAAPTQPEKAMHGVSSSRPL